MVTTRTEPQHGELAARCSKQRRSIQVLVRSPASVRYCRCRCVASDHAALRGCRDSCSPTPAPGTFVTLDVRTPQGASTRRATTVWPCPSPSTRTPTAPRRARSPPFSGSATSASTSTRRWSRPIPGREHCNGGGIIHGGFLASLLDTTTGWAVHARVAEGAAAPHVHLSVQYVRAAVPGVPLVCRGRCVSVGRRVGSTEAEITQGGRRGGPRRRHPRRARPVLMSPRK